MYEQFPHHQQLTALAAYFWHAKNRSESEQMGNMHNGPNLEVFPSFPLSILDIPFLRRKQNPIPRRDGTTIHV